MNPSAAPATKQPEKRDAAAENDAVIVQTVNKMWGLVHRTHVKPIDMLIMLRPHMSTLAKSERTYLPNNVQLGISDVLGMYDEPTNTVGSIVTFVTAQTNKLYELLTYVPLERKRITDAINKAHDDVAKMEDELARLDKMLLDPETKRAKVTTCGEQEVAQEVARRTSAAKQQMRQMMDLATQLSEIPDPA